ncbi:hypothetical protein ACJOV8_014315 [Formosa sp. 3Alg 14/1]|uniref:hypothetical protein n=1 Tax=Formosa sp. 3Alg 14/1 TaxID=3382190 RepID=UPI0039BE18EA
MKLHTLLIGLCLCLAAISCNSDETTTMEQENSLKAYELMSLEWKLNTNNGQTIIEEKLPEFYFRNDSDTIMQVVINPLENLLGNSKFVFNDSLRFAQLNYPEIQVFIPDELSLLSETYGTLYGGTEVPFNQEPSAFPFSYNSTSTYALNGKSILTSNYTVFFKQNTATILAIFRETTTGERLELDGTWTGVFFNNIKVETIANAIDVLD